MITTTGVLDAMTVTWRANTQGNYPFSTTVGAGMVDYDLLA